MQDQSRKDEFLTLLAQHESQISGFLNALVCHREDAQDLMQEATITMWRNYDQFEAGTNFGAWGIVVAKNAALNYFQSRKRRKLFTTNMIELLADTQAAQGVDNRLARRKALHQCLDKLSAKDRELIANCYAPNTSIKAVSKEIGRSVSAIHNSLTRIRRALFACIESSLAREERIA